MADCCEVFPTVSESGPSWIVVVGSFDVNSGAPAPVPMFSLEVTFADITPGKYVYSAVFYQQTNHEIGPPTFVSTQPFCAAIVSPQNPGQLVLAIPTAAAPGSAVAAQGALVSTSNEVIFPHDSKNRRNLFVGFYDPTAQTTHVMVSLSRVCDPT